MDPSGRNRWQPVANAIGANTYTTHLNPVIFCMTDDPEEARRWARELAADRFPD